MVWATNVSDYPTFTLRALNQPFSVAWLKKAEEDFTQCCSTFATTLFKFNLTFVALLKLLLCLFQVKNFRVEKIPCQEFDQHLWNRAEIPGGGVNTASLKTTLFNHWQCLSSARTAVCRTQVTLVKKFSWMDPIARLTPWCERGFLFCGIF